MVASRLPGPPLSCHHAAVARMEVWRKEMWGTGRKWLLIKAGGKDQKGLDVEVDDMKGLPYRGAWRGCHTPRA